jgi:hypothetical protein
VPTAVAAPSNGNIVRAQLSGGNVQTQALAPSPGSAWTTWTTLTAAVAPTAGLGVALAANGANVALAFLTAASTIAVYKSTNSGASWSSFASLANGNTVTDLALAYAPNGDLLLVSGDNTGTLRAFRSSGGGAFGAAVSLLPGGSTFINSVALAYSGDWLLLFGWNNGAVLALGSALFGNGGQQPANTWSAVTDVLGLAPGNSDVPVVTGFAWGPDGGHAIIVENWAILGGYTATNAYALECSSPAAFAGGYWTEPAPFPYTSPNGATLFGPDLAASQATAGHYVAAATNLVATLAAPADLDVSARVIAIDDLAEMHAGSCTIALDNSDGALTSLATARTTLGLRLDLAFGYVVNSVPTTSPFPQRWVVKAEASWVQGRHLVTLTCHDGWQLLHQLTSRRDAQFGTTLGVPTRTVDQILHWLCAKAGIDYTSPGASTLRSRTPNFQVLAGRSLGTVLLDLLEVVEGFLLMTATGATVIGLSGSDTSTYSLGGSGQHPLMQIFHTQELQPANHVTVYTGTSGAPPDVISAQAFDATDAHLLGVTTHEYVDLQLESANAQLVAQSILRKAQISPPTHSYICPPQVAQELGDVVTLTDPLTGLVYAARVQAFSFTFDRDKGTWQQTFTTSAV